MEEKKEHNFKFGIYLRNEKVAERIFSADQFNPVVRYSVNIRKMIPSIIQDIQSVLQTTSEELTFSENHGDKIGWKNAVDFYKMLCDLNKLEYYKLKVPVQFAKNNPNTGKQYPIKGGTEFKFGLYINQNPIVERNFYVDNYNPEARFSIELMETVREICESITDYLTDTDKNQMWDDYTLINVYELNIQEVRELSNDNRSEYLKVAALPREKRTEYLNSTGNVDLLNKLNLL